MLFKFHFNEMGEKRMPGSDTYIFLKKFIYEKKFMVHGTNLLKIKNPQKNF